MSQWVQLFPIELAKSTVMVPITKFIISAVPLVPLPHNIDRIWSSINVLCPFMMYTVLYQIDNILRITLT